jgi:elongation factor Ts
MQDIESIKKLREETGAGVLEVKNALEESNGDYEKAQAVLMKKAEGKAAKKGRSCY